MRVIAFVCACAATVAVSPVAWAAKGPPPPPKATSGRPVTVVARGIPTPTAFAFVGGQVFVGGWGDEQHPKVTGGVYAVTAGKPHKLARSPAHVAGLAFNDGTLYVSGSSEIVAWSGWDGTRFTKARTVASSPKGFTGFNGIAFGNDGKLYAGVSLGDAKKDDYSKGTTPYANDVVTVDTSSGQLAVAATGLRQPWQLAVVPGHDGPLVSDLGQENLGRKHPVDRIVEVTPGASFGFPSCPAKPASCSGFDKPFATFPAHSSPMGLAPLRGKVYVALFGGTGKGPEVVSLPASGGSFTPVLTGFVAPVVALGVHGGRVYAGDLTGAVYSVRP